MKHLFQSNFCIEFPLKKSYLPIIIQSQIKMLGLMKLIDYKITHFVAFRFASIG